MSKTPTGATDSPIRDIYDKITGDENARVCTDISDDACREQPTNFFIHLVSLFANKAGDLLASPKLILPWLLATLGAPAWMAGMLVPIREALALLPQLVIAGWMRARPVRKWFWVAGAAIQGSSVLAMIAAAVSLSPAAAGAAVLLLLTLFALGRGVCSASYKDVQGKTIAKTRRGTVSGYAASAAGGLAVALGLFLWAVPVADHLTPILLLLAVAGVLWVAAAFIFAGLREFPGATEGGGNAVKTAVASLSLIRDKPAFGRFIAVRGLLVATALAAPYYAQLARTAGGVSIAHLAILLGVSGLASLVAAPFWGRLSDYSSRQVLIITGVAAALLNALVALMVWFDFGSAAGVWPFAIAYFLLAGIHAGVRLGRKTYLTDLGTADDRARLTAVANTTIGIVLLAGGAVIAAIGMWGAAIAVAVLALPALAAAGLAYGLPELEQRD
ncbi:MFS transporter [Salinisphaera sp. Q1T1-3]|uniref:MFS transporter n=1 Tax=Salinisphaera sp. Q1T1-3 TaxID=2321229 RepID=UPI000E71F995|nr:MFS transporter [Salinisphaera sp. Q1T1-3]RJS94060.1 MFS transporter [Salinisphaera sp. Q1T1-3]